MLGRHPNKTVQTAQASEVNKKTLWSFADVLEKVSLFNCLTEDEFFKTVNFLLQTAQLTYKFLFTPSLCQISSKYEKFYLFILFPLLFHWLSSSGEKLRARYSTGLLQRMPLLDTYAWYKPSERNPNCRSW